MSQVPPPPSDPLGQPTSTGPTTPAAQSYNAPGVPPPPGQPQAYGQPGSPPQTSSNPFGNAPANENRVILGIIAIVLGQLGVHKFMMGHIVPGIIMIAITFAGSFVFCLGPIASAVIGIIEGIIYLTKTDEQFRQEYVIGKKQWF